MKTYLITLYSPPGPPPDEVDLTRVMADLEVVNDEIRAAGGWVFAGGLGDLDAATTITTPRDGSGQLLTDGPFLEAKEHLGGLSIVRAEDYDIALGWARRIGQATGLPVEVRPFQEAGPGQAPATE
jgi:hypothetical protein